MDTRLPPLRLAASTLREQAFDAPPAIDPALAQPLADWLDSTALSWEEAARRDPDIVAYLTNPPNYPGRVSHAIVKMFHGEMEAAR